MIANELNTFQHVLGFPGGKAGTLEYTQLLHYTPAGVTEILCHSVWAVISNWNSLLVPLWGWATRLNVYSFIQELGLRPIPSPSKMTWGDVWLVKSRTSVVPNT